MPDKPVGVPNKSIKVNWPEPGGIVAGGKDIENPTTVPLTELELSVIPSLLAVPPDKPWTTAPLTVNWKPAKVFEIL